jgi:hypothetical protein
MSMTLRENTELYNLQQKIFSVVRELTFDQQAIASICEWVNQFGEMMYDEGVKDSESAHHQRLTKLEKEHLLRHGCE